MNKTKLINCKQGEHKCKFHDCNHFYTQHTCGHEFCEYSWAHCPRCHGSELSNMLPAHPGFRPEIISRCKFELATNFDCPAEQILGVYGSQLGLDSKAMYQLIAPENF